MEVLAWRFKLNGEGSYDIYEEQNELGNWVYVETVKDIPEYMK